MYICKPSTVSTGNANASLAVATDPPHIQMEVWRTDAEIDTPGKLHYLYTRNHILDDKDRHHQLSEADVAITSRISSSAWWASWLNCLPSMSRPFRPFAVVALSSLSLYLWIMMPTVFLQGWFPCRSDISFMVSFSLKYMWHTASHVPIP